MAIYSRMDKAFFPESVSVPRWKRIFHVLYKRLGKVTKFAWLFFPAELVSAQVPGQSNPNLELPRILPRSATP